MRWVSARWPSLDAWIVKVMADARSGGFETTNPSECRTSFTVGRGNNRLCVAVRPLRDHEPVDRRKHGLARNVIGDEADIGALRAGEPGGPCIGGAPTAAGHRLALRARHSLWQIKCRFVRFGMVR